MLKKGARKKDIKKIAEMHKDGEKVSEISRAVQVLPEVVRKLIKSYKMPGPSKEPAGEDKKTTPAAGSGKKE